MKRKIPDTRAYPALLLKPAIRHNRTMSHTPDQPSTPDSSSSDNSSEFDAQTSSRRTSPRTVTAHDWLEAARPHTWANGFAPVIAGTGAAALTGQASIIRAILAAIVGWFLVIGVNYANDYSDGIRGTDDDRSGPFRLTASGLVQPYGVKHAAFVAFGVAALAGLILCAISGHWWLILVGAACVVAAWFYTGGKHPYGYRGLGEVAVFVFFGLVAVLGTQYTQADHVNWAGVAIAVAIGSVSAAVNLANNLRDIPSDAATGKITLAVRLGDRGSRMLWCVLAAMPVVASILLAFIATPWALIGLLAAPILGLAARPIVSRAEGKDLIPVLGMTGRAMVVWALVTTLALWLG